MEICKYCNSIMQGEFETLNRNTYRFFYVCSKCKSVYEGQMQEDKKGKKVLKSRWFNPEKGEFESGV